MRKVVRLARKVEVLSKSFIHHHSQLLLFAIGTGLLVVGLNEASMASNSTFDPTEIKNAVCKLFQLQQGAFGALVMTVAGIGAIVSSSMGAYRAAVSLIVVSCGSFILQALVSLFFGTFQCNNTGVTNVPTNG
jgi:hypothetical protein